MQELRAENAELRQQLAALMQQLADFMASQKAATTVPEQQVQSGGMDKQLGKPVAHWIENNGQKIWVEYSSQMRCITTHGLRRLYDASGAIPRTSGVVSRPLEHSRGSNCAVEVGVRVCAINVSDALRMVLLSEGVTSSEEHAWERFKNEVIEEALTLCEGHSMLPEAQHAWRQCF
eukprot:2316314-Amphidinium_carterae.1